MMSKQLSNFEKDPIVTYNDHGWLLCDIVRKLNHHHSSIDVFLKNYLKKWKLSSKENPTKNLWLIFDRKPINLWSLFGRKPINLWSLFDRKPINIWSIFDRKPINLWSIFDRKPINLWSIFDRKPMNRNLQMKVNYLTYGRLLAIIILVNHLLKT